MCSCNPTKKFAQNEYLLTNNTIEFEKGSERIESGEVKEGITGIIKQKPNKKILGIFRFHLGVYTWGDRGKPNRFNNWLKSIGEEPVILDTTLTNRSAKQIGQYLGKNGYFNSFVRDSTVINAKRKRARVYYKITVGEPYRILSVTRTIYDPSIEKIVLADTSNTLIRLNNIFSESTFQKERERITFLLKNNGYYFFNQQYIEYKADSSLKSKQVKIRMVINNINGTDSTTGINHQTSKIANIYVRTDYDALQAHDFNLEDTVVVKDIHFIYSGRIKKIRPEVLAQNIFIQKDSLYRQDLSDYTYRSLSDLSIFKFVNIRYEPLIDSASQSVNLNCIISLAPFVKQNYSIELEGTNNGGNFGIAGDFGYHNKNTFRGAELYELKLRGLLESQKNFISNQAEENTKLGIFNTYEYGIENDLYLPKVIFPFKWLVNWSRYSSPKSSFEANYNFQQRPEFKKINFDFSAGAILRPSKFERIYLYPAELNFVDITLNPEFVDQLLESNDLFLFLNYTDHFIANGRYSYVFNNQQINKLTDFVYFRANFEIAGNLLRLISNNSRSLNKDDFGRFEINGNPFAQYVKPDVDFRYYQVFNNNSSLVYRIAGGVGIPYLNSVFLPYEKNFYAGGTSDLRAFVARTVGPGSYSSDISFERIGEIKINTNIEYRFDILRILKGAFFTDAGNIWLLKNDLSRPGGQFKANKFLDEMAVGTGFGFRFDFTFFIFRLDFGIPLKDPARESGDRWLFKRLQMGDINTNFGIGFPF